MKKLLFSVSFLALVPFFAFSETKGSFDFMFLNALGSFIALIFALILAVGILKKSPGTERMQEISKYIQEGAMAYLKQQYKIVGLFFILLFIILGFIAWILPLFVGGKPWLSGFVPFAFITGGFFSGLSGFIGMKVATKANCRTAQAASESLNSGLRVAFNSGTVMGMVVVGLGLLDISLWWILLRYVFMPLGIGIETIDEIPPIMITFGMGASSMALFARLGGGIY
nr:sodium/proton-translocating pyrophosphatase [Spirochaetota bacterium]